MENQNKKNSPEIKLPALLSGSEYNTDDSDKYRTMNLLGLAVTIVVHTIKDSLSDKCKKAWLILFEQEYEKAQLYYKKDINFIARHNSNVTPITDDAKCANPIYKMTLNWLRKSLQNSPDWHELYTLIEIQINRLNQDSSAEWWNKVKSVCRKIETANDPFDPIAEILSISKEYDNERGKVHFWKYWKPLKKLVIILKKIPNWIYILAALLTCLSLLGLLEPIKVYFSKLFAHK